MRDLSEENVQEYYKKILKLSLFYLKNREEAEDIAQDIFVKVYENLDNFRGESDVYTWIYRISINSLNNFLKRKKIVEFISFDSEKKFITSGDDEENNNPARLREIESEKDDQMRKLNSALEKLSAREKTAFFLFHYENMKQKQIAEVMETSVSAVESLIFKGMKKIKKFLARL